jgi:hypothetical protein
MSKVPLLEILGMDTIPQVTLQDILTYSGYHERLVENGSLLISEGPCPVPNCGSKGTFSIDEPEKRFYCHHCHNSGGKLELVITLKQITSLTSAENELRHIAMAKAHDIFVGKNKPDPVFKPGWYYFRKSDGNFAVVKLVARGTISVSGEFRPFLVCQGLSHGEPVTFTVPADECEFASWTKCKF